MRISGAAAPVLAVLVLSGCNVQVSQHEGKGPLTVEERSVEKSNVEMVSVEFNMNAGKMRIRGGATKLMEGRFEYDRPSWKPEVRYDSTGFRGRLLVKQGSSSAVIGDTKNEWDVKLAPDVPMDIAVNCGAGEGELDLRGMSLRSVQVKMGAGRAEVDLRSDYPHSFDVKIEGGVGEATIRVPKTASVEAQARGGLGEIHVTGLRSDGDRWVSESPSKSRNTIRIDVKGGIGAINIIAE